MRPGDFRLGLLFVLALSTPAAADDGSGLHLRDMYNHPWFLEVMAASGVGWFLGTLKGFSGSKEWLARYGLAAPLLLVLVLDALVFVGVGAFFGTAIYNPGTLQAAMAAGMSWPIGLGALTK